MNELFTKLLSVETLFLLLGYGVLFLLIGIVLKRRKKLNREIVAPRVMRYMVLPMGFVYILLAKIIGLPKASFSIKTIETLLIIFIIVFLLNMINHLFFSDDNVITQKERIPKLGRDILHVLLIILASAIVLSSVWGFDLGKLLTVLGVSSFVIGLALQEPLGNLFNGVALLMAKPFQKGDWIHIGEEIGKVVEFNWSSIKIVNRSNELIIIPNNRFAKEQIKNISRPSRIHAELITIGFSYKDDPIKVKKILANLASNTEGILNTPKAIPLTISYDDFYITYGLKFFIKDFEDMLFLRDRLMTQIYDEARIHKLTIPFPIRDVIIREDKSADPD